MKPIGFEDVCIDIIITETKLKANQIMEVPNKVNPRKFNPFFNASPHLNYIITSWLKGEGREVARILYSQLLYADFILSLLN
jgi:hypothetical protein